MGYKYIYIILYGEDGDIYDWMVFMTIKHIVFHGISWNLNGKNNDGMSFRSWLTALRCSDAWCSGAQRSTREIHWIGLRCLRDMFLPGNPPYIYIHIYMYVYIYIYNGNKKQNMVSCICFHWTNPMSSNTWPFTVFFFLSNTVSNISGKNLEYAWYCPLIFPNRSYGWRSFLFLL